MDFISQSPLKVKIYEEEGNLLVENNLNKKDNLEKKNIEDIVVENIDKGIDTIKELNTNNFYINISNNTVDWFSRHKHMYCINEYFFFNSYYY